MKRYIFSISLLCGLLCCSCNDDFNYYTMSIENTTAATTITEAVVSAELIYRDKNGRQDAYVYTNPPTIEHYGVYYSTSNRNPGKGDSKVELDYSYHDKLGSISVTLTGLHSNTAYYARMYVRNYFDEVVGDVIEFETNGTASVSTLTATNITYNSATLNGSVSKGSGNTNLQKRGFVLSTSSTPTIESNTKKWEQSSSSTGNFSTTMTGLNANTKYYYRAYAIADGSVVYGSALSFTTKTKQDAISIVTNDPTNVTSTSATVGGTINIGTDAKGTITEIGIMYLPTTEATAGKLKTWTGSAISSWTGSHTFTATLSFGGYDSYVYWAYYIKGGQTYSGGSKTVTRSGGGGGSTKGANVSDFVGTYSLSAYDVDQKKYVSWDGVQIYTYNSSTAGSEWVAVYGLNNGYDYALGEHDATNKAVRLYHGRTFSNATFTYEDKGDTLFIGRFFPVYTTKTFDEWHAILDGDGYDGSGEGWLTFDSSGKLKFGGAATADSEGYRANGYNFGVWYYESGNFFVWDDAYVEVELTKTSSSVSAPAKAPQVIEWHAPMLGNRPYKATKPYVQRSRVR